MSPQQTGLSQALGIRAIGSADFDRRILEAGDALAVVFVWASSCFNCGVAQRELLAAADEVRALGLAWFEAGAHADPELATRFVLHGTPSFFFLHRGFTLGRMTGWRGLDGLKIAVAAARTKMGS
ncbi:thioredoxin family protein [Jeongeupia chitinilytica]|uniref:Thiol reductase thioredoxin n=1 Tax=Jeongeupia chitinilytica TaxID=1041641 RepID=A0ABQ3H597_9NEIS|nr:thioredoxin family protein [Jeongeupia chitinilytica]GHD65464.1 thiol reductase thioredoxin [Jeongeupia chitinilytica]